MYGVPGFGLFDGMGKGKTATALFEINRYRLSNGPTRTLVVCPKAAIDVWHRHSRVILPDTEVLERPWHMNLPQDVMVITNFEAMQSGLKEVWWDYVVVDECHYISNRDAQRTKAVKAIMRVKYKRALSGTPFLNTPDRLWSVLNWLYPRDWRGYWPYFNRYVSYSLHTPNGCAACGNPHHQRTWREIHGPKNSTELKSKIRGYCIRRTNPEKNIDHEPVELDMYPQQHKAYDDMAKDMLAWLETEYGEDPLPAPVSIAQQMRMRQFASSYMHRNTLGEFRMSEPSNKLDAMLDDVQGTDMPLVVFSNFTQLLNLAAKRLADHKVPHGMYTGQNPQTRDMAVEAFQRGHTQVMLCNIKAGGIAITLSTGRHAIFLDESYSPTENNQAWGRLFNREDNPHGGVVKHYRSRNSIETREIPERLAAKLAWFREVMDD
jgi:SNF2 family DNA or RNA helicase